jgi:hypothetical protein
MKGRDGERREEMTPLGQRKDRSVNEHGFTFFFTWQIKIKYCKKI